MAKSQATLTESSVKEILRLLDRGISHGAIAEEFHVSKKTISRINTGETWSDISKRTIARDPPTHNVAIPSVTSPDKLLDLLDEVTGVKNHFGLSFDRPLNWGYFDWYDGTHSVATDGFIMWESTDLTEFALKLYGSQITGAPIFSDQARELPTFGTKALMTYAIGGRYTVDADAGGVAKLVADDGSSVMLRKKYVEIATKLRFELRQAGDRSDILYFTRAKTKTTSDTASVIMACVAVTR